MSRVPVTNASPCIVAMPMRRPVNDPGPDATPKTSMDGHATPSASSSDGSRSPCEREASPSTFVDRRSPVLDKRDAARARRGVQCQYTHAITLQAICQRRRLPAMRQYLDAKNQHRDSILLFRMGDFYEMFYEDALVAARALDLTLTSRSKDASGGGIPMCGVPHHAVDTLHRAPRQEGLPRRHLRSGRRPDEKPKASSNAKSCASCRPAR